MSTQVSSSERPTLVSITDRDLLVTLIYLGIDWKNKVRAGMKTIFYYDATQDDYKKALDDWQHSRPVPVSDIREVFKAEKAFNSAVHDDY